VATGASARCVDFNPAKNHNMNKLLLAAAATMLAASISHAGAQEASPKRELRGVWISTHLSLDWPNRLQTPAQQRAALAAILDHNKATGMNAAFLQVRSQADAMYPSEHEPWSYYLTNQQGSAPARWSPGGTTTPTSATCTSGSRTTR
jgi:uncharacterized lipoprotein YddW (UPF0748 family)